MLVQSIHRLLTAEPNVWFVPQLLSTTEGCGGRSGGTPVMLPEKEPFGSAGLKPQMRAAAAQLRTPLLRRHKQKRAVSGDRNIYLGVSS